MTIPKEIDERLQREAREEASAQYLPGIDTFCRGKREGYYTAALSYKRKMWEAEQWIPVGERLPDPSLVVLVWVEFLLFENDSEEPGMRNVTVIDFGQYIPGEGGGRMEAFSGPHGETPDNITHWKPLPQPPTHRTWT